jgi:tetratricopeptide (TPR) repeat protein
MPETTTSRHTVFVSHTHADNKLCDRYVAALRARGLNVWYDRTNMQAGRSLSSDIEAELRRRSAFVVIVTPTSLASQWVKSEIAAFRFLAATDPTRLFLPVRAALCEMPLLWSDISWIDAVSLGFDAAVNAMAEALGAPATSPTSQPVPAATSPTRQPAESVDDLLQRSRRLRQANPQESIRLSERATQLDPRDADAWSELGKAYTYDARYHDALAAHNRALALDNTRVEDWRLKGLTLFDLDQYEEALAVYEHGLKLDPDHAELWFNKSIVLRVLKRNRESDEAYKRSEELP